MVAAHLTQSDNERANHDKLPGYVGNADQKLIAVYKLRDDGFESKHLHFWKIFLGRGQRAGG